MAKEYRILEYLPLNKNRFLSKEQIQDHVWGYAYKSESNVIEVLIKNIRRKKDGNRNTSFIQTKRNLGNVIHDAY
ncbi:hypothetical protein CL176_06195 [Suicoccus acidiformans]|uniref:OmpR/PhoB-type domain-containing protein n=1 Tax=Suicoccus acidiformans TaxID=2036206 RepID=A0A347WKL1_9LACT|nr:winged helix-turn-helix domain-containing protein [Suicoccus acidiformans]AXY25618.1 hypothetical protein CL176_06195 [Suicoccus acidiformans]